MVKFQSILLTLGIMLLVLPVFVSAWFAVPLGNDHAELTRQSILAVGNNDSRNIYSEPVSYISSMKEGAGELDRQALFGNVPKDKQNYLNSDYSHFYHSNGSTFNNQWPSALNESYDWLVEAISAYAKGDKSVAYLKLGYMLHLLEDVAVPAHTHLAFHGDDPFDYLEFKADADNIDASTQNPIKVYPIQGNDLYAIERQFNELARKSYNESDVQTTINTYYTNGAYIGVNGDCGFPLLGQTCSPAISAANVTILEQDLMPKAVRYSAGLAMRVYDIFQSLDWPTENHDFRRTGFTLLKGDMPNEDAVEKMSFVLKREA